MAFSRLSTEHTSPTQRKTLSINNLKKMENKYLKTRSIRNKAEVSGMEKQEQQNKRSNIFESNP